jgi:hypothetical protein
VNTETLFGIYWSRKQAAEQDARTKSRAAARAAAPPLSGPEAEAARQAFDQRLHALLRAIHDEEARH